MFPRILLIASPLFLVACPGNMFIAGDPNALDGKVAFTKDDGGVAIEEDAGSIEEPPTIDAGPSMEASLLDSMAPDVVPAVDASDAGELPDAPDAPSPIPGATPDAGPPMCNGPIGTFSCTQWAVANCSATNESLCCLSTGQCGCKTSQTVCH